MATTLNGLRATAMRGLTRIHVVDSSARIQAVEARPDRHIEDINTAAYRAIRFGDWTHATVVEARKLTRRKVTDVPGW